MLLTNRLEGNFNAVFQPIPGLKEPSVHDKKIIEHTTTDYYELGLEGLVAVLKSLSTVVFWMS